MEREQGRKDAIVDMSFDLSEGEKDSTPVDSMPRMESSLTLNTSSPGEASAPDREKPAKRLYIVLISLHGLVRGDNIELGRDSDTGGQADSDGIASSIGVAGFRL